MCRIFNKVPEIELIIQITKAVFADVFMLNKFTYKVGHCLALQLHADAIRIATVGFVCNAIQEIKLSQNSAVSAL